MPGDRLTSPEAAKESTDRDGVRMQVDGGIAFRRAQRQVHPTMSPASSKVELSTYMERFVALSRLFP